MANKEKTPWYEDFDPFNRPSWDSNTTSPFNYMLGFLLFVTIVVVSAFLIIDYQNTRVVSVHQVGEDDITAGQHPSGFSRSDGTIEVE
eukprot:1219866-Amorphochlora_amoeboformis.AAC.2